MSSRQIKKKKGSKYLCPDCIYSMEIECIGYKKDRFLTF